MSGDVMVADADSTEEPKLADPRVVLADWAKSNDEWLRLLVAEVLASERAVGDSTVETACKLFDKRRLGKREPPTVAKLDVEARQDESASPLSLTRLSNNREVSALYLGRSSCHAKY
ncbi:hypothetical protein ACWIDS_03605 [Dietzia maris]